MYHNINVYTPTLLDSRTPPPRLYKFKLAEHE